MAKKFMFVCLGILALAGAYAIGANRADAQSGLPGDVVQLFSYNSGTAVVTASGDFYARNSTIISGSGADPSWNNPDPWVYLGNVFNGAVNGQQNTLGGVKGLFR